MKRTFGEVPVNAALYQQPVCGMDMPFDARVGQWAIWLPHSCDEWVIGVSSDPAEVVRDAEELIASLQQAVAFVKEAAGLCPPEVLKLGPVTMTPSDGCIWIDIDGTRWLGPRR